MPAEALGFGFKLSSPRVISDSPHRQKSECSRESKPPRTGARGVGIAPWNRAQDCIGFAFGLSLPTKCEGSEILRWWGSECAFKLISIVCFLSRAGELQGR